MFEYHKATDWGLTVCAGQRTGFQETWTVEQDTDSSPVKHYDYANYI